MKSEDSLLHRIKQYKCSYLMVGPYMLLFFLFTALPVLISIYLSFNYYNLFQPPRFIFLSNFKRLFLADDVFFIAVRNTFLIALITGPVSYIACFVLAWMINEYRPWTRAVLTTVFYAPSMSGTVYMIWRIMFSSDSYGLVNSTLMRLGLINAPILWLEDPHYVLGVVILASIWMSLGAGFLAFIAGFQGIDRSLYEAAAVDGIHNRWQELWFITLPAMKPQLMFGAVMQITASFGVGDVSANLAGFPSVDYAAHTIVNHINDYGGIRFEMGYASAIATILFVVMVGANELVQRMLKKVGS